MDTLTVILALAFVALIPTAYAAKIGAPYAPTFKESLKQAFAFINLGSNDTFVDLGAGDGKTVAMAAKRGAKAFGIELSPILWLIATIRTLPYFKGTRIRYGNFYKQNIDNATVVFTFLMPQNMERLRQYLAKQSIPRGKYFLSYIFRLPGIEPLKVIRPPKSGAVYIYDLQKLTKQ